MKKTLLILMAVVLVGCESILGPANAKGVTRNGVPVWACPNCDKILGPQYDRFGNKLWSGGGHRRGDGYTCRKLGKSKKNPYVFD